MELPKRQSDLHLLRSPFLLSHLNQPSYASNYIRCYHCKISDFLNRYIVLCIVTAPQSKHSVGAIVVVVIGGLAGLGSVLVALWFLIFRKNKYIAMGPHKAHQQSHPPIESPSLQEAQGSYMEDYNRWELEAGYVAKAAGRPELDA